MGLLSHTISVQKSQEFIPLILERRGRKKRGRQEEEGGARRRWWRGAVCGWRQGREERVRGI